MPADPVQLLIDLVQAQRRHSANLANDKATTAMFIASRDEYLAAFAAAEQWVVRVLQEQAEANQPGTNT